jgi:hypothetical protein
VSSTRIKSIIFRLLKNIAGKKENFKEKFRGRANNNTHTQKKKKKKKENEP